MAHYRVLETCFVNNQLHDAGAELYLPDDFPFGPHLEPLDDAAKAAEKKYDDSDHMLPSDPNYARVLMQNNENQEAASKEPIPKVDRKGNVRGVVEPSGTQPG